MPDINLYDLYSRKLRKFGLNNSIRFQNAFVDAVNATYSEFNSKVFLGDTLAHIGSFDDVIDSRLKSFVDITFDASTTMLAAMGGREIWAIEYDFEIFNSTNTFTDTITTDVGTAVVISITNSVISIDYGGGATLAATYAFATNLPTIKFVFDEDGNSLYIDGSAVSMTYTVGTSSTSVALGTITPWVIDSAAGMILKRYRALSTETGIFDFPINDDTTTITDMIGGYVGAVNTGVWDTYYIEPSSGLDERYLADFNMGLDFHLQDGGEFAIEPEEERERKWYGRGIRDARDLYQQNTAYVNPLGL